MINRPVTVTSYQERWKDDFELLKSFFLKHLGDMIIEVHHVGSTSVTGLAAKPIIDIDLEIQRESRQRVGERLTEIGYQYKDLGIIDRDAFKYVGEENFSAHNMYVCPSDSRELARHLAFRDYLQEHEDDRVKYSSIKFEAIESGNNHIMEYMDYKGKLVTEILVKAMKWKGIEATYETLGISECKFCNFSDLSSEFDILYTTEGDKQEIVKIICDSCTKSWEETLKK